MAKIIKKALRNTLSKFNIPKIIVDDKPDKEIGEVNTEHTKPHELPEWIKECGKELHNEVKGKEIIVYIDGKEVKRGVYNG
jgi:hypothetical protein